MISLGCGERIRKLIRSDRIKLFDLNICNLVIKHFIFYCLLGNLAALGIDLQEIRLSFPHDREMHLCALLTFDQIDDRSKFHALRVGIIHLDDIIAFPQTAFFRGTPRENLSQSGKIHLCIIHHITADAIICAVHLQLLLPHFFRGKIHGIVIPECIHKPLVDTFLQTLLIHHVKCIIFIYDALDQFQFLHRPRIVHRIRRSTFRDLLFQTEQTDHLLSGNDTSDHQYRHKQTGEQSRPKSISISVFHSLSASFSIQIRYCLFCIRHSLSEHSMFPQELT